MGLEADGSLAILRQSLAKVISKVRIASFFDQKKLILHQLCNISAWSVFICAQPKISASPGTRERPPLRHCGECSKHFFYTSNRNNQCRIAILTPDHWEWLCHSNFDQKDKIAQMINLKQCFCPDILAFLNYDKNRLCLLQ